MVPQSYLKGSLVQSCRWLLACLVLWFSPCWVCKYQILSLKQATPLPLRVLALFPGSPPKKRKRNPIAVQDQGTHAELTHAQRSAAQAQAQAHHTLSLGWGLLGPFYPFFPFPCLLWLFGLILFFSFLHHPILPSAKPSTLLTFLLGRSLVPSLDFVSFRFASLSCVSSSFHQHPSPT